MVFGPGGVGDEENIEVSDQGDTGDDDIDFLDGDDS